VRAKSVQQLAEQRMRAGGPQHNGPWEQRRRTDRRHPGAGVLRRLPGCRHEREGADADALDEPVEVDAAGVVARGRVDGGGELEQEAAELGQRGLGRDGDAGSAQVVPCDCLTAVRDRAPSGVVATSRADRPGGSALPSVATFPTTASSS
jgi:hypothetical protein